MIHCQLLYAYAACDASSANWDTCDVSTPAGRCCSNRSKAACRSPRVKLAGWRYWYAPGPLDASRVKTSETPAMVSATVRFEGHGTTSGCGRIRPEIADRLSSTVSRNCGSRCQTAGVQRRIGRFGPPGWTCQTKLLGSTLEAGVDLRGPLSVFSIAGSAGTMSGHNHVPGTSAPIATSSSAHV
jgi:hypothetical protein